MDRFSDSLPVFNGSIENAALTESLDNLAAYLEGELPKLSWSDYEIAISWTVSVSLPPLGTYDGIDIHEEEPVLIVLNLKHYPDLPPRVYTDRLDFPKDQLSHLYVAKEGKPPAFCLVRGSLPEWYANKQLKDVVIRTQNWFRDAVAGELTEDGDQFEPLRLEGYIGTITYDYDQLAELVHAGQSYIPSQNFALALFERNEDDEVISFKFVRIVTQETFDDAIVDFLVELKKDKNDSTKKEYHVGYVVWSTSEQLFARYSVNLPHDWHSFQEFCGEYGIDLTAFEKQLVKYYLLGVGFFPVVVAIKRPKPLIGFSSSIEFINFRFKFTKDDSADDHVVKNFPIVFQSHNQPLSLNLAKRLSGFINQSQGYSLVYGCGALGSKVVMHLARCGSTKLFLVDPDLISPHNMARFALTAESIGLNKAYALKRAIQRIFSNEELTTVRATSEASMLINDGSTLKLFMWIFDFTASYNFLTSLVKAPVASNSKVCRAYLTDAGQIGVLLLEGAERNPRVDDLQVILYASCRDYAFIADWLQRENGPGPTDILVQIGMGCNSETTVLSDDVISLHAAHFSGVIKTNSSRQQELEGKIYLNQVKFEPEFTNQAHVLKIPPLDVLKTRNESGWEIRLKTGLLDTLKQEMANAYPHETGGVFIGCANYKTKTIHVVDSIPAPPDSKANSVCFFRGIDGLPEQIASIHELSGGQLGYIGEWHTHPLGPNRLSETDMNTVHKFKAEFDELPTPLPVFLMVLTPDEILSFVY